MKLKHWLLMINGWLLSVMILKVKWNRYLKDLTQRIKELAERYEAPLPQLKG